MSDDFRDLLAALVGEKARFLIVGAHALIRNKRAAGRAQDLADIESLEG